MYSMSQQVTRWTRSGRQSGLRNARAGCASTGGRSTWPASRRWPPSCTRTSGCAACRLPARPSLGSGRACAWRSRRAAPVALSPRAGRHAVFRQPCKASSDASPHRRAVCSAMALTLGCLALAQLRPGLDPGEGLHGHRRARPPSSFKLRARGGGLRPPAVRHRAGDVRSRTCRRHHRRPPGDRRRRGAPARRQGAPRRRRKQSKAQGGNEPDADACAAGQALDSAARGCRLWHPHVRRVPMPSTTRRPSAVASDEGRAEARAGARRRSSNASTWSRATSSSPASSSCSRPDELKALAEAARQTIDIVAFIPEGRGRPHLLRQGLLPGPGQARREAVLAAAARRCAKAAAAPWRSGPGAPSSTW